MPLASVNDVAGALGRHRSGIYRGLWELHDAGLAELKTIGWAKRSQERWHLTPDGCAELWEYGLSWNSESGLSQLLERLPAVEALYDCAQQVRGAGELRSWQWTLGQPFEAVAGYRHGWAAFFWSGVTESEMRLSERFEALAKSFAQASPTGHSTWPGLLVVAAADPWQRDLVMRVAQRYSLGGQTGVWCVYDGSQTGGDELGPSRGWVWLRPRERGLGGWSLERRLDSGFGPRNDCVVVGRVLDAVMQWPGVWRDELSRLAMYDRTRVTRALGWLREQDWVRCHDGRYEVAPRGVHRIGLRDGLNPKRREVRMKAIGKVAVERIRAHEDGVMRLCGGFGRARRYVVPGWRELVLMPGAQLAPDAMVYLRESPFGAGWHYVEYERRARAVRRVEQKLRGYREALRREDARLLLVCWGDSVEDMFRQAGAELPIATTTLSRLRAYGPVGDSRTWRLGEQPVLLG